MSFIQRIKSFEFPLRPKNFNNFSSVGTVNPKSKVQKVDEVSLDEVNYARVNTNETSLNLREGPGTDTSVITSIPKGTRVVVEGEMDGDWTKISYEDDNGQIHEGYVYSGSGYLKPEEEYHYSNEVTVLSGDTLSAIALRELGDANRYRELAEYNHITNPNHIEPGQKILIPLTDKEKEEEQIWKGIEAGRARKSERENEEKIEVGIDAGRARKSERENEERINVGIEAGRARKSERENEERINVGIEAGRARKSERENEERINVGIEAGRARKSERENEEKIEVGIDAGRARKSERENEEKIEVGIEAGKKRKLERENEEQIAAQDALNEHEMIQEEVSFIPSEENDGKKREVFYKNGNYTEEYNPEYNDEGKVRMTVDKDGNTITEFDSEVVKQHEKDAINDAFNLPHQKLSVTGNYQQFNILSTNETLEDNDVKFGLLYPSKEGVKLPNHYGIYYNDELIYENNLQGYDDLLYTGFIDYGTIEKAFLDKNISEINVDNIAVREIKNNQ